MTKLFLVYTQREDGNIWLQCVKECGYPDLIYVEFDGPEDWVGKFFYPSSIKYDGLDYDTSEDVTLVGNNKEW